MSFQSIINFFMSPLGFIIIFGVFSTGARMFKSAQEQQTKKRDLQKQRVAQRDSLRTGARTPLASSTEPVAQTQTQTKPEWDTQQEQRRERIDALRKQRQAQLEKIRQQRQNKASAPQTRAPAQSGTQGMAKRPPAQQPLQTTARAKPTPKPKQQPAPQRAVAPVIAATQQAAQRRRVRQQDPRAITTSPIAMSSDTPISRSSIAHSPGTIRSMIRTDLRSAILAKEVLGTPLGLRAPGSDPISGD